MARLPSASIRGYVQAGSNEPPFVLTEELAGSPLTRIKDLTGQTFGVLTVLAAAPASARDRRWTCQCACGATYVTSTALLQSGRRQHCGCQSPQPKPPKPKHGYFGTRLYRIWADMKASCRTASHRGYVSRGARGLTYTAEWENFVDFRRWAQASGYAHDKALRRRDRNGDFDPENCWWGPSNPRGAAPNRARV
jgi:hypothetical protein